MLGEKTRDRAVIGALVLLLAGVVLAGGQITGTFAVFTADTENPGATASGGWIPAPSSLSSSVGGASNDTAQLTWVSGNSAAQPSPNPVSGQQLQIADGGSASSASCGTYADQGSALGATTTTTTDGGAGVPFTDWWCYQMVSTSGGSWTNSAEFTPVRLLVPISVVFGGNGDHKFDAGDTITITFNQAVSSSSVLIHSGVCQVKGTSANGFVVIGFSGTCRSSATYGIGKITNITVGKTGSTAASVGVAGAVVTVKATGGGQNVTTGGTFVASTSITASAGAPAACISASCQLTPTGSF